MNNIAESRCKHCSADLPEASRYCTSCGMETSLAPSPVSERPSGPSAQQDAEHAVTATTSMPPPRANLNADPPRLTHSPDLHGTAHPLPAPARGLGLAALGLGLLTLVFPAWGTDAFTIAWLPRNLPLLTQVAADPLSVPTAVFAAAIIFPVVTALLLVAAGISLFRAKRFPAPLLVAAGAVTFIVPPAWALTYFDRQSLQGFLYAWGFPSRPFDTSLPARPWELLSLFFTPALAAVLGIVLLVRTSRPHTQIPQWHVSTGPAANPLAGPSLSVPRETPWTVNMPGQPSQDVDTMTLQAWAGSRRIRPDSIVVDAKSGIAYPAKQVPGVFSDKSFTTALLLSLFLGYLGIDRFYLGQTGLGIAKLLTAGGCGIWALVDFILIAMRKVTDVQGRPLA